ncbi:hypothetical protein ACT80S_02855 [Ramlibacter sp. MAHUQ-53]|uniref:hypothetical protein n=1 Tax=unclassified Ramlibacter TaxID=2617605 RepID=UPI003625AF4C
MMQVPLARMALAVALAAVAAGATARNDDAPGQRRKQEREPEAAVSREAAPRTEVRIGATFTDRDREVVRTWYGEQAQRAGRCPPGLAKKNNGCLPPGQAKKYQIGRPLPSDVVWYSVPPALVTRLPPLPVGHGYIRVGAEILLMDRRSNVVIDVAAAFPL